MNQGQVFLLRNFNLSIFKEIETYYWLRSHKDVVLPSSHIDFKSRSFLFPDELMDPIYHKKLSSKKNLNSLFYLLIK